MAKIVMIGAAAVLLAFAGCARPDVRIETRQVLVPSPVPCLASDQWQQLLALAPGAIPDRPTDVRQREGIYLKRLSQYRRFADAVRAVAPACIAPPVTAPAAATPQGVQPWTSPPQP